MKIAVDLSVFVKDVKSVGRVSGFLELEGIPSQGDTVSFLLPLDMQAPPCTVRDCNLLLEVERVTFTPLPSAIGGVSLSLEDLILQSDQDALMVVKYLESSFNLFFEES
jgi:hypothetical protein